MKFYNRETEIAQLKGIEERSRQNSQMTVIVGRRRIGKTRLIQKALEHTNYLYFFVGRKAERLLCEEFVALAKAQLDIPFYGEITQFKQLFAYLMDVAKTKPFTLVIDEFQEFHSVNPSVFSDIQNIWDSNKEESKLNLIVSGSVYSIMTRIFEHQKQPLFGRANERIHLQAFDVLTLKTILADYNPNYSANDLVGLYAFTGGVAKYVELFLDKGITTYPEMVNEIFRPNSYFLDEGKNLLIAEFGKEYQTYFSILSLIASSKTSRAEIESILEKPIGGFLDRLENEYSLLKRHVPTFAKEGSRTIKYAIDDNFLRFWFRFLYKYKSAIEIGNFDYLKQILERDFDTFRGHTLEKYFRQQLAASKRYSQIGTYWEKGNQNEIDIVALNELNKTADIFEVKLNPAKIDIEKLKEKAPKLLRQLSGYTVLYKGLSLEDV